MDNKEELMKTYLLFLYSFFETHEDAENFSFDVLGKCSVVKKVRFIKEESSKNLIIIFESDFTKKEISEEFRKILTEETIKFYFLFDRNNIASANLPVQMKEFMFKCVNDKRKGKACEVSAPTNLIIPPNKLEDGKYDFGVQIYSDLFNTKLDPQTQNTYLTLFNEKDGVKNYSMLINAMNNLVAKNTGFERGYF